LSLLALLSSVMTALSLRVALPISGPGEGTLISRTRRNGSADGRGENMKQLKAFAAVLALMVVVVACSGNREQAEPEVEITAPAEDRKSTRLNSSHVSISYVFFCLK